MVQTDSRKALESATYYVFPADSEEAMLDENNFLRNNGTQS